MRKSQLCGSIFEMLVNFQKIPASEEAGYNWPSHHMVGMCEYANSPGL